MNSARITTWLETWPVIIGSRLGMELGASIGATLLDSRLG